MTVEMGLQTAPLQTIDGKVSYILFTPPEFSCAVDSPHGTHNPLI